MRAARYYSPESIRDALGRGVVHFFYTKASGETREAFGTLNSGIIDDRFIPAASTRPRSGSESRPQTDRLCSYFDLGKGTYGEWRSFRIENLIGIDDENPDYVW